MTDPRARLDAAPPFRLPPERIADTVAALREAMWEILGPAAKARHAGLVEI
ncbi:MAG: hypothetical protein AABZ94_04395 [Candidatus Eisenbacteria bacterium]